MLNRSAARVTSRTVEPNIYPTDVDVRTLENFIERCSQLDAPSVLEVGARRTIESRSTLHQPYVPNAGRYIGTDIEAGHDVDVVADVHELSAKVGEESFDVIIACSVFEHLKYPHLAAHEVMKTLKVGGLLFLDTHQTFPVHPFPYDYFRFTREALAGLFGTKMGFHVISTEYKFPAMICAPEDTNAYKWPAFLNVSLFGEKVSQTPQEYIYEFDGQG
jgi:hypothetical protein